MEILNNFYKALTIQERYSIIESNYSDNIEFDKEAFANWRNEMSILSNKDFSNMIKANNFKQDIFSMAVNKNPNSTLKKLYNDYVISSEWYKKLMYIHNISKFNIKFDNTKISYLLRYFIVYVDNEISTRLNNSAFEIASIESIQELISTFFLQISDISIKAITLEINKERVLGKLKGDTPAERYQFFINSYEDRDKILSFFDEYPVLARVIINMSELFIRNVIDLFNNLIKDKDLIKDKFNITDFYITNLNYGHGDSHNGNKSVVSITLKTKQKLLYKPKNLNVNIAFSTLCDYINKNANFLKIKTAKTISIDDHGYEEFIHHIDCKNNEEVKNYYRRFGHLLALMYLLNGTDIHMENLIANGENPVIIDLETILQQPTNFYVSTDTKNKLEDGIIKKAVFSNVERIMLLPSKLKINMHMKGVDISALSGKETRLDEKILQIDNLNTDEIKFTEQVAIIPGSQNLPIKDVNYLKYKNNVIDGFLELAMYFIDNRDELLGLPEIKNFKGLQLRQIVRNTNQYAKILNHSYHPDFLTDMLDREKVFENLWSAKLNLIDLTKKEVEAMMINDIPFFTYFSDSKDIFSSQENYKNLGKFVDITSYDYFLDYILNLDKKEIMKQVSLIELAYDGYSVSENVPTYKINIKDIYKNLNYEIGDEIILYSAEKQLKKIISEKINSKSLLLWMTVNTNEFDENSYGIIPADFYDGIYGIALVLYYFYKITGNENYYKNYKTIIDECNVDSSISQITNNYGYSSIFSFIHMSSYLDAKELKNSSIMKYIDANIQLLDNNEVNNNLDFLNGTVSLLNSLIRIYSKIKNPKYLSTIVSLGEMIVKKIEQDNFVNCEFGFAHGYSSIALVLLRLYNITKSEKYYSYASALFEKENIINLLNHEKNISISWCRGLIGSAISRMESLDILKKDSDEKYKIIEEIDLLHNKIIECELVQNDSLCHGNSGVVEYFLKRYLVDKNEENYLIAKNIVKKMIDAKKIRGKYHLKQLEYIPSIGLFTGEAGIVYEMIRMLNADIIPSILI